MPREQGSLPALVSYDPERFRPVAANGLTVVGDAFGQAAILDARQELVCMFFPYRNQLAAWMPDGTRWGPASLTGGPPTPQALEKIGHALRAAAAPARR
jgi:hypothetical protein